VYRIFNTLLFFLGMFYLFRIFELFLKKPFWSIALTILFFTSPLLVYYGNNFLSNSTALAFSIIGWYYFFQYSNTKNTKWFYVSMAVFLVAASLKVTALFSVFAITGIFLLELIGVKIGTEKYRIFNKKFALLIPVIVILIIPILWIFYANGFNQAHETTYFSTTIFPIWDLNADDISGVMHSINTMWAPHYFHISFLILLPLLFVFWLFQYKKANKIIWWSTIIIIAEIVFYIALQFWTFRDHDYYTINMYILPILLVIGLADWVRQTHPQWLDSKFVIVVFAIFIGFNIQYTHTKIDLRYNSWMNDYEQTEAFYSITPVLRTLGIKPTDKVISIPDMSHASLYLMNQPGWTEYTDQHFNSGEKTHYNQDRNGVLNSVKNGAKYLILLNMDQLYQKPYLQEFSTHLIGSYHGALIFDLTKKESNFSLGERKIKNRYVCNADSVSEDGKHFIGQNAQFENAQNQTSEFSHSGLSSIKLNLDNPYGMTLKLNDIKEGERFKITFWRKVSRSTNSTLVVTSGPIKFNNSQISPTGLIEGEWVKYQSEFTIPWNIEGQELKIFLYNPDQEPVYFDDLEIIQYHSYLQ